MFLWRNWGIVHFEVLKPVKTFNADLHCEQLDRLNKSSIVTGDCQQKRRYFGTRHCRIALCKINDTITHHIRPISHPRILLIRSVHFLIGKNLENFDDV